jgi:hypothetical protein
MQASHLKSINPSLPHGFAIIDQAVNDERTGGRSVWLARRGR